jgi:Lysophospholipase
MKKKLGMLGGLVGVSAGLYLLFRNRPEEIKRILPVTQPTSETVYVAASDGLPLALTIVQPQGEPKAVVQIIHGILEHRKRYLPIAEFLANHGFAVVISDNRGHGDSVNQQNPLGHMPKVQRMVDDQVEITTFIQRKFVCPVYLFGHSFGSMIARIYLQKHDQMIAKLLLTGTVCYQKQAPVGLAIAAVANHVVGEEKHSWIMKKLSGFGSTDRSWLTNDLAELRKVEQDPLMLPGYDNRGTTTVWEANVQLNKRKHFKCRQPQLPILSITGGEDHALTGGTKGLAQTKQFLQSVGYQQVTMIDLAGMKHEVLNEIDHQDVYQLILNYFNE